MELTPHVERLRGELAALADGQGADVEQAIERVVALLESPVRLNLLEVLSTAADEITRELAPGSVEVRLRGRDVEFVVTPPDTEPTTTQPTGPAPRPAPEPEQGQGTTRINLRLPEHLKAGIEQTASAEHVSINAWLVRLVDAALSPEPDPGHRRRGGRVGESWSGWVQ